MDVARAAAGRIETAAGLLSGAAVAVGTSPRHRTLLALGFYLSRHILSGNWHRIHEIALLARSRTADAGRDANAIARRVGVTVSP